MNILIVSATRQEIEPLIPALDYYKTDYLITGVGMIATSYSLGNYLNKNRTYDLILNVGICGSLFTDLKIGQTVRVTEDRIFKFGAENNGGFISIEEMGFGKSAFNENTIGVDLSLFSTVKTARGITVNTVHGSEEQIEILKNQFHSPTVESMEGAAVFYVADLTETPVIQLRNISNYIEPRDTSRWNIPLAISNLTADLTDILQKIHTKKNPFTHSDF